MGNFCCVDEKNGDFLCLNMKRNTHQWYTLDLNQNNFNNN